MEIKLNTIRDKKSASHAYKRVGRGIGSGKGKTCGRGVKGQKSRSGVSIRWFEGGQTPIYRRLPKRGFNNAAFSKDYAVLNLGKIQALAEAGFKGAFTYESLLNAKIIAPAKNGLKVLGSGELKSKAAIEAAAVSEKAKAAIEQAGGTVLIKAAAKHDGKKKKLDKPARVSRIEKKKAARSAASKGAAPSPAKKVSRGNKKIAPKK
jgi:large subunit ribosomal protein L15